MRYSRRALAFLTVLAAAIGIFWLSFNYFLSEEQAKAQGRLSLYRSTVVAELDRFSHLTYILARDPYVVATAEGASTDLLDVRLSAFADQAGLDAIYLMQPDGVTISASNARTNGSFVGHNYSFRPYFQDASAGAQGRFYGIGTTTGLPGYFIADAVRDPQNQIAGVIAIKLDLSKLEESWRVAGEQVLLTNKDGVVLLASNPAVRYQVLSPLTDTQRADIDKARQFTGQALLPLDWSQTGDGTATIDAKERMYLRAGDLPHDWQLHYFADQTQVRTRSWLVTGLFTILASAVLIFTQFRKTRQIGAALRRSEAEEAQLRQANERLAVEIEDRRTAERRLKRTQDELERAGRLAALGQLSASVTHELGQPIAAMRNHLAAAEMSPTGPKRLMPRLADLVDRMEGITRQLKFFARTEGNGFSQVDLRQAMQASLALVEPNLTTSETTLDLEQPDAPVLVFGDKLRLEQVLTNLLRNAIDAMQDEDPRHMRIAIGSFDGMGWCRIQDEGHGLGDATLTDLQEPFVTTRESGHGMGLGLAISTNIVAEHHGRLSAQNGPSGGAEFRVEIPLYKPSEDRDFHE
ncbi:ATP-binding protein [Cognatishimia sp. WU-CL00825]|uniref:sensor histidine kinase n=1 Tax=Cognatishimia sp. WU-CL00825 TaxID=3127658 RepID=UPI0031066A78